MTTPTPPQPPDDEDGWELYSSGGIATVWVRPADPAPTPREKPDRTLLACCNTPIAGPHEPWCPHGWLRRTKPDPFITECCGKGAGEEHRESCLFAHPSLSSRLMDHLWFWTLMYVLCIGSIGAALVFVSR